MPPKIEIGQIVKVVKTDEEWKQLLAPMAYGVLRHENTERPFTDNMHDNKNRSPLRTLRGASRTYL